MAIVRTGVGAVNAAHAVTLFLAKTGAREIVACGIGGAYPASWLRVGDVVCAESGMLRRPGRYEPVGVSGHESAGFSGRRRRPSRYSTSCRCSCFPFAPCAVRHGIVCTGTDDQARTIEARTGGAVESMEGAAVAHVAHLHGVPVGEVRGISNIVTDRDTRAWRIKEAAPAAQEAVVSWIARR